VLELEDPSVHEALEKAAGREVAKMTRPASEVSPQTVRTPVVGSGRRCPVCNELELSGRQTVCSAACRRARTRQRETAARQVRDQGIRVLLETALRKLEEGGP